MSEVTPVAAPVAAPNPVALLVNRPIETKARTDELVEAGGRVPVIEDQEMASKAADLAKMLHAQLKRLEDERRQIVGPINESVKLINAKFKIPASALAAARKEVLAKITAFQIEQQRQAREVEAEARREQEEAALAQAQVLEDAGDVKGAEEVLNFGADAPAPVVAHSKTVRSDYGATSSLRTTWQWEVTDMAKVPLEHLVVDEKRMNKLVKEGARHIFGLRIYETQQSVVR